MKLDELEEAAQLKRPFRADGMGHYVFDADGMVYEVRGWGALTGGAGRRLSDEDATAIQVARGEYLASALSALPALLRVARAAGEALDSVVTDDEPTEQGYELKLRRVEALIVALRDLEATP